MANEKELDAKTQLAEALWNDPETRALMEEAVTKKFPGAAAHLPNVAMRQMRAEILDEANKTHEKTEALLRERDARDALRAAREEIINDPDLRIRPDEIAEIEKLMLDETVGPIGSHKTAARVYRQQQQVASSAGGSYSTMQVPGVTTQGDDYKWLVPGIGKPMELDRVARERAEAIMADFRSGRGSKWD